MLIQNKKARIGVICLFFICLANLGTACRIFNWEFKPGAIIVSGCGSGRLSDKTPGELLTVHGYRRVSDAELSEISVYHILIFVPAAPVIGGKSSCSQSNSPVASVTETWIIQNNPSDYENTYEKSLEIKSHGLDKTISIGSETFMLSKGNLFIVRMEWNWKPTAVQVPRQLNKRAKAQEVLDFLKTVLQEDSSIQELELYQ